MSKEIGIRRLLPDSIRSQEVSQDPQVFAIGDDEATDVLEALSSETTRDIYMTLSENPSTPPDLAERLDLTLQNVHYHLRKLRDADLIEEVDMGYSEKGVEMSVYAPTNSPIVFTSATGENKYRLRTAIKRLFGAVSVLSILSLLVQWLTVPPTSVPPESAEPTGGIPIALGFFAGGLTMLVLTLVWWYTYRV